MKSLIVLKKKLFSNNTLKHRLSLLREDGDLRFRSWKLRICFILYVLISESIGKELDHEVPSMCLEKRTIWRTFLQEMLLLNRRVFVTFMLPSSFVYSFINCDIIEKATPKCVAQYLNNLAP